MTPRAGTGWQYLMTDLSLILFMVTASALTEAPLETAPAPASTPALGDPVAVWRGGAGAPPLRQWLALEATDPRLRLTVVAPLGAGVSALDLAREAGRPARVLLEPDGGGAPFATLTFDRAALAARPSRSGTEPENTQ